MANNQTQKAKALSKDHEQALQMVEQCSVCLSQLESLFYAIDFLSMNDASDRRGAHMETLYSLGKDLADQQSTKAYELAIMQRGECYEQ